MHLLFLGIVDGLLTAGVYALMATGLNLVFGVMRIVNMAQPAFVILGGYLSFELLTRAHVGLFTGLLITMPAMFAFGVAVERLVLRRLGADREIVSLIATFALAVAIEGGINLIFSPNYITINSSYATNVFSLLGLRIPEIYVYVFALSAVLLTGLFFLLQRTSFGRMVRAATQNPLGARLVGVNMAGVSAVTFGLGCALAAAGGMAYAATNSINAGSWYDLLPALFAIVIVGGLGSLRGMLIASALVLVCIDVSAVEWSPVWSNLLAYGLVIIVLVFRPQGLFGPAGGRIA